MYFPGDDSRNLKNEGLNSGAGAKYAELWPIMRKDLLWTEAKDVWYVHLDPLWADFQGTPATGSRPIPFIDALPASLWLYKQEEFQQGNVYELPFR